MIQSEGCCLWVGSGVSSSDAAPPSSRIDMQIFFNKQVAIETGSINCSLVFAVIEELTTNEEKTISAKKISDVTSLSEFQIRKAIGKLEAHQKIKVVKKGMPCKRYFSIIDDDESVSWDESISFADILSGQFDSISKVKILKSEKAMMCLVEKWAELFGVARVPKKISAAKKRAFKKTLDEGRKISDFAKGIEGMSKDPWDERRSRCEWTYVHRHLDRWIDLHDEGGGMTKVIKGVVVPKDYEWDSSDENLLSMGKTFDLEKRKWK